MRLLIARKISSGFVIFSLAGLVRREGVNLALQPKARLVSQVDAKVVGVFEPS